MTPQVPKVVVPKTPIQASSSRDAASAYARGASIKGRQSFVSAGTLARKAFTLKSSLLG